MGLLDFVNETLAECEAFAGRRKAEVGRLAFLPFEEYESLPELRELLQPGRQRLQQWEDCRHEFLLNMHAQKKWRLSHEQTKFLDEMRNSAILKMYEGQWDRLLADRAWLRKQYHIRDIFSALMVTYPRRSGKTLVQSIFGTVSMLTQHNGNIAVMNPGQNQARGWLNYLYENLQFMKNHDHYGFRLDESRQGEVITITANATHARVSANARGNASSPQHVNALRGGGTNLFALIVDEFYFMCDEAFVVFLPMAANGCAFILGSSMALRQSKAYELRNAKYKNGDLIFRAVDHRDRCDECIRHEENKHENTHYIDSRKDETPCPHVVRPPKHFRTPGDEERLQGWFQIFGGYDTEMMNIPPGSLVERIFDKGAIERCLGLSAARVSNHSMTRRFMVAVDPGQSRSNTAIISFAAAYDAFGYEALSERTPPQEQHIIVRLLLGYPEAPGRQ